MTEPERPPEDDEEDDTALDSMLRAVVAAPPVDPNALLARVARTRWSPGDVIGERLIVERELGAGGMGVVYLAHDTELERPVAVKICRRQTEDATARMLAEARAAASLHHDNVIVVHDVGTTGDLVYVAMEYVDGGNLRQWLQTPRSRDAIVDVVRRAGQGLAAAHAAGLVHRDFKPDNILVGSDGRVRVADFGLAQTQRTTRGDESSEGHAGTPGYMPPEATGESELDDRADVFAFGVTLHEALTGTRVDGPSAVARSLPGRVRGVILACVDPTPERRPPLTAVLGRLAPRSATPVLLTTGLFVAMAGGLAIAAQSDSACAEPELEPPAWDEGTRAQVERALRAGVVIDSDVLVGRVLSLLDDRHAQWMRLEHELCVDHRDTGRTDAATFAAQQACLTVRAAELGAVVETLSSGEREHVDRAPGLVERMESIERCHEATPSAAASDPEILARMTEVQAEIARASTELGAGEFAAALQRLEVLGPEVDALADPGLQAERWAAVARAEQSLGNPGRALELARDHALPAAIEAGDPRRCGSIAISLVGHAGMAFDYVASRQWALFAEAWLARAGDPVRERLLLEVIAGRIARVANDRPTALRRIGRALALSESHLDAFPSIRTVVLENWGAILVEDGRRAEEGLVALREAFEVDRETWGRGALRTWDRGAGLLTALTVLERREEAMTLVDEQVAVAERLFGPTAFNTLVARSDRGRLLMLGEQLGRARAELQAVLDAAPTDQPGFFDLRTSVLQQLAILDQAAGDFASARARLEAMLAITEQMGDAGRYKRGLGLNSLAILELRQERFDRAAEAAEQARTVLAEVVGDGGSETLSAATTWIRAQAGGGGGGRLVDEAAEIRRQFAQQPDSEQVRIHELTYGVVLRQAGRFEEALAVLEPLLDRYTTLGHEDRQLSVAFEIAVTLKAAGDDEAAAEALERARALSRALGEDEAAAVDRWAETGEWRPL